ncbi:MAG TPA: FAD-dependent monooxygenase [Burkholderiaceae bacterium]|nr:FAD-dependent monooxygenase [Burkholderiaceae bacterium]
MNEKIAILGGGPIGLVAALLLARRALPSVVVDARSVEDAQRDPRLLALSRGTWDLLTPLLETKEGRGALPPRAPIRDVFVSSAGEFGAAHLAAADLDGEALGATVRYGDLVAALAARVANEESIEVRRPVAITNVEQRPHDVRIALADGAMLTAPLAINAEGWSGTAPRNNSAGSDDVALIGEARVAGPAAGSAFERFTREGPLALLPTPASDASVYSIVWCMRAAAAQRRLRLAPAELQRELQQLLGRIGRVEALHPLRSYPLQAHERESVRAHRVVAVGNAAQTLHPVAGQGFNLGVRDCATLADCLAARPHDALGALAEHARRREQDRAAIVGVTRWLPALFSTRFAPIAVARALGLTALDVLPPLRREFMQLLMFGVRT